jgi:hypothetical protein
MSPQRLVSGYRTGGEAEVAASFRTFTFGVFTFGAFRAARGEWPQGEWPQCRPA